MAHPGNCNCEACKCLRDEPSIMTWISVNDRLPDISTDVLVLLEEKHKSVIVSARILPRFFCRTAKMVRPCGLSKAAWIDNWEHELIESEGVVVTHWAMLPAVPEVGK